MNKNDKPGQTVDVDTLIRSMLDSRKNWQKAGQIVEMAFGTICYLSERGVNVTLDGKSFPPGGMTQVRFRRLVEARGLLNDDPDSED